MLQSKAHAGDFVLIEAVEGRVPDRMADMQIQRLIPEKGTEGAREFAPTIRVARPVIAANPTRTNASVLIRSSLEVTALQEV